MKLLGEKDAITKAKHKVLEKLTAEHNNVVAYGPFKGMKLSKSVWWGEYDLSTKILGAYEDHVANKLFELREKIEGPFVDIGAADGYFAVGMAMGNYFSKVYAYEISEEGRESLLENAKNNDCENRITIEKEANYETLEKLMSTNKNAVILMDIEGCEYDLLDVKVLELLKNCSIICELHPWRADDGFKKQEKLIENAKKIFKTSIIQRDLYNPNCFAELHDFTDDERLLALSEGRKRNMQWLVMETNQY